MQYGEKGLEKLYDDANKKYDASEKEFNDYKAEHDTIREEKGVDPEIIRLIKKAKLKVHNAYERDLRNRGRSGDIFALKNFGWKDQQDHDHTTGGQAFNVNMKTFVLPHEDSGDAV